MLLVVLTNRQDKYLPAALTSLSNVTGITHTTIVDDSGDTAWRQHLALSHEVIPVDDEPAGYTKAMQLVWQIARNHGGPVFLLEEDFTIDKPVNLTDLDAILNSDPTLAQVALQRQAWYPVEHRYGLIGAQRRRGHTFTDHGTHLTHTSCFTGNPSLIAERTFQHEWPDGTWTEDAMTRRLVDAGMHFAYYGHEGDEYVTHHGRERADTSGGY